MTEARTNACGSDFDEVLQRPRFGLTPDQALSFIEEGHDICEMVTPKRRGHVVAADPDDDAGLECALAADAAIVVSGDAHLLELGPWRHIRILSPADGLRAIEGQPDA
jgi:predicted nucleic acid-binding protein